MDVCDWPPRKVGRQQSKISRKRRPQSLLAVVKCMENSEVPKSFMAIGKSVYETKVAQCRQILKIEIQKNTVILIYTKKIILTILMYIAEKTIRLHVFIYLICQSSASTLALCCGYFTEWYRLSIPAGPLGRSSNVFVVAILTSLFNSLTWWFLISWVFETPCRSPWEVAEKSKPNVRRLKFSQHRFPLSTKTFKSP